MAGEKLTRIKIRDGQGISQPVPIQVTADQVTFNNSNTYNNGTIGYAIKSIQTNIDNINVEGKVDIIQEGHAGKFLAIDEQDRVVPKALSSAAIEAAMEGYNFTEKINEEIDERGYENQIQSIESKISGYSNSRFSSAQRRISLNQSNISTLFSRVNGNTGQISTLGGNISTLENNMTSQIATLDGRITGFSSQLAGKVNTEDGKGLSTHDFTDEYLVKLDKISFGKGISPNKTNGKKVIFGENSVTSRIGFWGNKTTKIGIAISNTEDSKRWRLLAQVNTGNAENKYLGLTLQDYDTSTKRKDKQVYNTEYFLPGESFTVSSGTGYSGLITSDATTLHFFIPMPRRCDHPNIKSITATFSKTKTFSVRCPFGGYLKKADGTAGPIQMDTNDKKFEFIKKSNGIAVKVTNKNNSKITNDGSNNMNVSVYFTTSFKFTFN